VIPWLTKLIGAAWHLALHPFGGRKVQASPQDFHETAFVRVLDPSDRWLNPASFDDEDRAQNFRGRPEWDISVAMELHCRADRVVACLHGARREVTLNQPAYFRFTKPEVEGAGGELNDTDAMPPWPEDYNKAHHDIVKGHASVAERMAALFAADSGRVSEASEHDVLCEIAAILAQYDVHERFQRNAQYRFRRMFKDGGEERRRWIAVAQVHRVLLKDHEVLTDLRKMYQDKASRDDWATLMGELRIGDAERNNYR